MTRIKPPRPGKLYPKLTIHMTLPEFHIPAPRNQERWIKRPRPGFRYSLADLTLLIHDAAHKITTTYPKWEFRMIRIKPDEVRFIYCGKRPEPTPQPAPPPPELPKEVQS